MDLTPQLRMLKPTLADLPALALPEGFSLRSYQAGDGAHWERILAASFGGEPGRFSFDRTMRRDPAYRPERVLFVVAAGVPVATASAWRAPGLIPDTGMVHFVGAVPEFQGQRLGYWVTLATLHGLAAAGLRAASLTTDDFRLPAIKTYLRLGFEPVLVHENQRERWRQVWRELRLPEMETRFAAVLAGPVWQPPVYPADETAGARSLVRRRRQHPERPVGGSVGDSDSDALADESLYHPALLGRAGASMSAVVAGADCRFELWFEAGPAGLPTGTEVRFQALGRSPFSTPVLAATDLEHPGGGERHYSGRAQLAALPEQQPAPPPGDARTAAAQPAVPGFVVAQGALAPGERVTLRCGAQGGCHWTPWAGRLEIHVLLSPGQGEPTMRLPEPVVIQVGAGTPAHVEAFLPGSARPGAAVQASVRVIDRLGNRVSADCRARFHVGTRTRALSLPGGACQADLGSMGLEPLSCRVSVAGLPAAQSNRAIARCDDGLGVFFGDLHAPLPATASWAGEVYRWARQEKRLDFAAAIPRGPTWLDNERWALHKHAAEANLDEGHFVTFLGYAWQHSHYGAKTVHFLGGDHPYLPADDPRYAYPARLYEALRASDALVIGQPPGQPQAPAPPAAFGAAIEADVERLLQVGLRDDRGKGGEGRGERGWDPQSEAAVVAAWRAGLRFGLSGGSSGMCDTARPGEGCLCAVWAADLTRRALFAALQARRTYAVSGRRIVLRFTVNGAPMGAELPFAGRSRVHVQAWAEEPIARLEVARNAAPWCTLEPGELACDHILDDALDRPAFYHARVTLTDGSLAVCSPVWIGSSS